MEFQLVDLNVRKNMITIVGDSEVDSWAWTTHVPTASAQNVAADLHSYYQDLMVLAGNLPAPLTKNIAWAKAQSYEVSTKAPAVRVKCSAEATSFTLGQPLSLAFVSQPEYSYTNGPGNSSTIAYFNVTDAVASKFDEISKLHNLATLNVLDIFAQPFVLPDDFGCNSIGLIILTLDYAAQNMSGYARSCNIDARWTSATSSISGTKGAFYYSYAADQGQAIVDTVIASDSFRGGAGFVSPQDDGTWKSIKIDPSWFALLAPQVDTKVTADPMHYPTTLPSRTTLESLLAFFRPFTPIPGISGSPGVPPPQEVLDTAFLESVIASYVADGISRSGGQINLNYTALMAAVLRHGSNVLDYSQLTAMVRHGDPDPSFRPTGALARGNMTQMVMRAAVSGYALGIASWFDVLSAAVLVAHILLALGHTLWVVVYRGDTSEAWDTVTEMVAFALTSASPGGDTLAHTCAGVRKLRTMGKVAWVEALPSGAMAAECDQEQLQLRVADDLKRCPGSRVEKGTQYGRAQAS